MQLTKLGNLYAIVEPTLCSAIQVYIKQTAANVLALAGRPLTLVGHVCRSEKLPQDGMDVSLTFFFFIIRLLLLTNFSSASSLPKSPVGKV
ncbi:hypothetical protein T4B_11711 [Trichinella pseudospiralis]|uniref:Uncharacterized protein n=1 Tax=Trichinella pseudospiralis TaxID=6337 RepID=A0A0V1I9Y8_TRIPS|nr:hypothetical protein T4B_11711 [Trichinella pseudospiralis]